MNKSTKNWNPNELLLRHCISSTSTVCRSWRRYALLDISGIRKMKILFEINSEGGRNWPKESTREWGLTENNSVSYGGGGCNTIASMDAWIWGLYYEQRNSSFVRAGIMYYNKTKFCKNISNNSWRLWKQNRKPQCGRVHWETTSFPNTANRWRAMFKSISRN